MKTTYWTAAIGIGFLLTAGTSPADASPSCIGKRVSPFMPPVASILRRAPLSG